MQRTTIVAPDDLLDRLRRVAEGRGASMAALIREPLEEKVRAHRRRPRSLGIGDSGRGDVARHTADEETPPPPWR